MKEHSSVSRLFGLCALAAWGTIAWKASVKDLTRRVDDETLFMTGLSAVLSLERSF
jgi:hypothetical protein